MTASTPHGPEYAPIGLWWTYDAPSLRVPDEACDYVSIWSTGGDGPAVLLVHDASGDHRAWEPLLPLLDPDLTVHALDARHRAGHGPDAAGVRAAGDAVGASVVVAEGDAADSVLRGAPPAATIVLWEPSPEAAGRADARHSAVDVISVSEPVLAATRSVGARSHSVDDPSHASSVLARLIDTRSGLSTSHRPSPEQGETDDHSA